MTTKVRALYSYRACCQIALVAKPPSLFISWRTSPTLTAPLSSFCGTLDKPLPKGSQSCSPTPKPKPTTTPTTTPTSLLIDFEKDRGYPLLNVASKHAFEYACFLSRLRRKSVSLLKLHFPSFLGAVAKVP